MGLLDQILSAVDNPNQQASTGQLASILSSVDQLSNSYNTNPSTMQSALSIVGNYVRSALQQKRAEAGYEGAQSIVDRYSGTYPNPQAVDALFGSYQIQQIVQAVAQRTGLNANSILEMLPILVPVVLNLLRTGSNTQHPQRGGNPVLNSFLDADRDGDVDIADAMMMAGRYLSR
ncbi:MAG TPA: hypothetical protein DCY88_16910 [Cyanobacteria bacterium UBA11372]|nr:hypothetical protein [Cyanobacteria bacterium UBA11372]